MPHCFTEDIFVPAVSGHFFFAAKRREPILKGFVLVTFGDHGSKVPREVLERGRL